jgi:hypothetical protein
MPFLTPPPQPVSVVCIATRIGLAAETATSPQARQLNSVIGELARNSSWWQARPGFDSARERLERTSRLQQGWDTYGAEPPNDHARALTQRVLDLLESSFVPPSRLMPSVEGGIGLLFGDGEARAGLEIYNSGEIAAATWRSEGDPTVWEMDPSDSSLKKAIEQIRVHLAA